jgi:hypothetical protein
MRKPFRILLLFIIHYSLFTKEAVAQIHKISGLVIDAKTKAHLAFVNIVIAGSQQGVSSDIDGHFTVNSDKSFSKLNITYVGYKPVTITVNGEKNIEIKLEQTSYNLNEVTILPGENPAHRIIRKAILNKDLNNPEKLLSYSYNSYNKFIYTMGDKGLKKDTVLTTKRDSVEQELKKLSEKTNFMLMESVTHKEFKFPADSKETIVASRTSGLKESSIAMLATEIQSFSFYNDVFKLSDKQYINPIAKGTFSRYLFIIEDTLFNGADSVFIISFRPFKGKNFDALKGFLYINTNGYAVQNVIAEPAFDQKINTKIQQQYEFINGHWFPTQLNADIRISYEFMGTLNLRAISRSYLKDIKINPDLKGHPFDDVVVETADDVSHRDSSFWNDNRAEPLTAKDKYTYKFIDQIGKEGHLDAKVRIIESIFDGRLNLGKVDIDINKIYTYNLYEGYRPGLGLITNDHLFKYAYVGGYFGYGTTDKALKYGADVGLNLYHKKDLKLNFAYINDVVESGSEKFYKSQNLDLNDELLRNYLIEVMDKTKSYETSLRFRSADYISGSIYAANFTRTATNGYFYDNNLIGETYRFTEFGFKLKFAFREKYQQFANIKVPVPNADYPVAWLNISKGVNNVLNGQFEYFKIAGKIQQAFFIKGFGKPTIQLSAGYMTGNVPYTMLFNGYGSYQKFNFLIDNTFQTMRMNEFLSDKYVSIFTTHSFGALFRSKKMSPEIVFANNIGYGSLNNAAVHQNIQFNTLEKGYFETGLLVNQLYNFDFVGLGLGAFYRYGAYSFSKEIDNFAFKLSLDIVF